MRKEGGKGIKERQIRVTEWAKGNKEREGNGMLQSQRRVCAPSCCRLEIECKRDCHGGQRGERDGKRGGRQASPTGELGELRSEGTQGKEGNIAISTHTQK